MSEEDTAQRLAVSEAQNAELWSRLRIAEMERDAAIASAEAAEAGRDELRDSVEEKLFVLKQCEQRIDALQAESDDLAAALDGLLGEARLCVKASAFRSPACLSEVIGAAEEALAKVRGE